MGEHLKKVPAKKFERRERSRGLPQQTRPSCPAACPELLLGMDYQLFTLLRNYYTLTPVNRLQLPPKSPPHRIGDYLVREILINEHHQQYPPSSEYQKRFWKWVIENLEELARIQNGKEACTILVG